VFEVRRTRTVSVFTVQPSGGQVDSIAAQCHHRFNAIVIPALRAGTSVRVDSSGYRLFVHVVTDPMSHEIADNAVAARLQYSLYAAPMSPVRILPEQVMPA